MIKILKQLHNGESKIELVQLGQEKLILRTAKLEDVCNEKMFIEELQKNNIKTLKYFERDFLKEDQLLIEYINGSPLIEDSLTSENIYKWGVLCKKIHQIKYDKIFKLLADNQKDFCTWNQFITERFSFVKLKIDKNKFNLSPEEIKKVKEKLFDFKVLEPVDISLLHCDLNKYNILIKDGELLAFDKGSQIFCGDYLFDLASVKIALDGEQFKEFIRGYGEDFTILDKELFDFYYLLRTIMRWPHPKKFPIKEVIADI